MVITSSIAARAFGNCFFQVTNEETEILVGRDQEIISYKLHLDGLVALCLLIIPMFKVFHILPKEVLMKQMPSGNNSFLMYNSKYAINDLAART